MGCRFPVFFLKIPDGTWKTQEIYIPLLIIVIHLGAVPEIRPNEQVKSKIVCKFFQVQSKSGSGFHGCSVKRTCLSVEIFAVLQAKIQPLAS